jgi:hypothetical protein
MTSNNFLQPEEYSEGREGIPIISGGPSGRRNHTKVRAERAMGFLRASPQEEGHTNVTPRNGQMKHSSSIPKVRPEQNTEVCEEE